MNPVRAVVTALAAMALVVVAPVGASADTADPLPNGQQGCLPPPTSTDASVPWGLRQLSPQRVWPLTQGGGVAVAVVDTGVDANTPQLAGRVAAGADVTTQEGGRGDTDCYGHGTFVAGIIAAAPAAGTGFTGIAPGATILPVRIAHGGDDVTAGALAAGIRTGVDLGARVINVSASTTVDDPNLKSAIDYAEERDVVVIASAANSAESGDPVTYPASYPSVVAVGAIDSGGTRANFSQTGPYLGLVAPGVDVVSIGPGGPGHWQGSGTSYAAPFVSGVAALVRAYHPELTARQVRERLTATADHPAATLPDPGYGWGLVNPDSAVTAVLPKETTPGGAAGMSPVRAPAIARQDELGPILTMVGLFTAVVLGFTLWLSSRFGPAGRRRRWRPARTVTVTRRDSKEPVQRR